ncbi:NPCBM/NEW2 domain-containing protein [Nocardioides zhouii]|uniref:Glycosyl hydrolase family 98 putative carbohydrate-binding module domain-containing protein n=1 Tax=Nocardioides zhouii TaxID=1168729 RepID=A0A4Q2T3V6_9ACTN|nr:NPCBM/NEW2 domain-containing protein [Nocardioides zhouii]RYC12671.1 hypothetical protein EUA94_08400 [Nocardioides zhouii]
MRLVHAVVAALLLALLAPPGVASTPEPSAVRSQAVRVSLSASPEWVKKGGLVTLSGAVTGVRGRVSVTIYQKTKGKSSWNVEAVKRTTRKGRFTHREDVKSGDRTYKACVKRSCDSVLVHMGQQPKQDTAVSISSLSAYTTEAGQPFTVSGVASGNLNGQQVQVQAYDTGSSSWSSIGGAGVQNGQWAATVTVTTAGKAVPLRAVFLGGGTLLSSVSAASTVAVYGWYYLYDGPPDQVAQSGTPEYDSFNVNGTNYSKSVGIYGGTGYTNYVEFNVGRACIRIDATVGVNDEASTSLRTTARLLVDNVTKWTKSGIALGSSDAISIDISNGLRLRLENTETVDGSGYLVFGDARALCAF